MKLQIETYSFTLNSQVRLCTTPEIPSPTEIRTVLIEKISFVIPVYNEESNLDQLINELSQVADGLGYDYEMLFVDDGSNDCSLDNIKTLAASNNRVRYLALACHSGQSSALYAGFQQASGDVVITLDADLQNDPADIPKLLQFYGEYDMINGWRVNRQDTAWKKFGSWIGNFVRNHLTWEAINDTGCSLKVMRADMLKRIKMYRGLHRFLPTLMRLEGSKVIEIPVNHRPRIRGVSKYGNLKRGIEGLYDVMVVRWMIQRRLKIEIGERHV
jgi:dolichol-phosphate mannosyltransferase